MHQTSQVTKTEHQCLALMLVLNTIRLAFLCIKR